ncbi:Uncharacterised protein [Legionella quateirensis]|uniref:Uncharacterized protein n=1 Tax=Legionella quateirensis TaxID=45072 RepID=A0A378KQ87_9GAMM|nr:Uncharacterised protein [Legionella quateirensis]
MTVKLRHPERSEGSPSASTVPPLRRSLITFEMTVKLRHPERSEGSPSASTVPR